jgi:hypothetical protein
VTALEDPAGRGASGWSAPLAVPFTTCNRAQRVELLGGRVELLASARTRLEGTFHLMEQASEPRPAVAYSVGALAEMFGMTQPTIRRALDKAAAQGLLRYLGRKGHSYRLILDTELPAVAAALREVGYQVPDPPPAGTPVHDDVGTLPGSR